MKVHAVWHLSRTLKTFLPFEPCFLTPFANIYWHSSRGLRHGDRSILSPSSALIASPKLSLPYNLLGSAKGI